MCLAKLVDGSSHGDDLFVLHYHICIEVEIVFESQIVLCQH